MKTIKHIFTLICLTSLLIGCSKVDEPLVSVTDDLMAFDRNQSFENQIMSIPNNTLRSKELISAYSEIMVTVLTMSKDQDFRNLIYENVLEANSRDEDYVLGLSTMTKQLKTSSKFATSSAKIESLVSRVTALRPEDSPMVFYPKAETLEDHEVANKNFQAAKNLNEPIVVLKGAYNNDYSAPGYKLGPDKKLVFDRMVTEEDAWENDVYVIGAMENVAITDVDDWSGGGGSGGNGGGGSSSSSFRSDGRAEFGGLIKLTDLNRIEHWFSGQLEFQFVVAGVKGSAGTIIKNKKFPQVKRKHFKDGKWYDFTEFIANWNKSNLGEWNVEKWIERDGGGSAEISIALPSQAATSTTPATPSYTVKVPSENKDDDLGSIIVQFSDNLSQEYPISYMIFKRQ